MENEKSNGRKDDKTIKVRKFIKENVLKSTIILAIIGIIATVLITLIFSFSDVNLLQEGQTVDKLSFLSTLKERAIILALILVAGWVPYFYISAIAYFAYIFMLSGDLLLNMELNGTIFTILVNVFPILIDIGTVAIIAAIGIYMCRFTSKKYKYAQRTSFSFLDVKIQFYEMTKKQEEYDKAVEKKKKKIEDMKKNDVKIDYLNVFKIASVIVVLNLLICSIQYVIN